MNIDHIIRTFNENEVKYMLIGGMHFLLRHKPLLTFDIDFWVEDKSKNLLRCEKALVSLEAEWGANDKDWGPVAKKTSGWLKTQPVYCLTSPFGAIDIFLNVTGLESWLACNTRAVEGKTTGGIPYRGISDEDSLRSQYALDKKDQRCERISVLKVAIKKGKK
jgi:hypothetical protein